MAEIRTVKRVDDLDGSEDAEAVGFALEGYEYAIDLSAGNLEKLREALAPYVEKATVIGRPTRRGRRAAGESGEGSRAQSNRAETAAIRQWAREHGHEVSDRGRIPGPVREAYAREHGQQDAGVSPTFSG